MSMANPEDFQQEVGTLSADFGKIKLDRSAALPVMVRYFQRLDADIAHFSPALACKAGCSYCCNYHVYISAPEAFALVGFLEAKLDPQEQKNVIARIDANVLTTKSMTLDEHIATNVRCAFLSDAGHCLVYDVRPGACHRHHAVDATPCKVTFENTQSKMENLQIVGLKMIADGYIQAALLVQQNMKLDASNYELHGAVKEALSNKASLKRWREGKIAFPSVVDRVSPLDVLPQN